MRRTELRDWNDEVLKALWVQSGHRTGNVIDARSIRAELDIELKELFAAVVDLVEAECLAYRGAGPKVEITEVGAMRCGPAAAELDEPNPPS